MYIMPCTRDHDNNATARSDECYSEHELKLYMSHLSVEISLVTNYIAYDQIDFPVKSVVQNLHQSLSNQLEELFKF